MYKVKYISTCILYPHYTRVYLSYSYIAYLNTFYLYKEYNQNRNPYGYMVIKNLINVIY